MKKITDYIEFIVLAILSVTLLFMVVALLKMYETDKAKETIVGAIFIKNVDDGGWNEFHYKGLSYACNLYGLRLEIEENIDETTEAAEPAIERLVDKGCSIIFLTSNRFDKKLNSVIESHPDVEFYTTSPDSEPDNMFTYYGRHYQTRYLAGMLAGRMTKTNVLGFIAGYESNMTTRSINAYALGAKSVNPDAVVKVMYLGSWSDAAKEKECAEKLIKEYGADVITYHASLHSAVDVAEELGVYSIGYNNDGTDYSEKYLGSTNFNWSNLYKTILDDFLTGDMSPGKYYWHGVVFGTVEFTMVSPLISDDIRKEIDDRTEKLINVQDVFFGDIYTNEGEKKCSKGQRISDNALLRKMNWFVEGVEFYE